LGVVKRIGFVGAAGSQRMRQLRRIPTVGQFVQNPSPILLGMGVFSGLHSPCDSAERERGIVEMKVARIPDAVAGVFDGDAVRRRILLIEETGDAEDAIAVRASGIAAKGNGEQLECRFLLLEIEAFDLPKSLVLAERCGEDRSRKRHGVGSAERGDPGLAICVDVYI
jgi:hypothetical protein